MIKSKYLILLRDRNFVILLTGLFGFGLGGTIFSISINWWILEKTNSEVQLGLVGMFTLLPMLIFGLYSGLIADIFNRKTLMIISLSFRGIIIILIPIIELISSLEVWHVYIIAFFQGISFPFFINTVNAIFPQLVEEEDNLLAANALADSSFWSASIIGSLGGGFLIVFLGTMNLFMISTIILIGSSVLILLINYNFKRNNEKSKHSFRNLLLNLKEGFDYLKTDKVLLILIITWMGINTLFGMGVSSIGWAAFSKSILNAGAQGYGLLVMAGSLSSLIGSLIIGHWGDKLKKGKLILIGFIWGAIGIIIFSFITNLYLALTIAFLWNFFVPLINVAYYTSLMERVPEEDLGKISGVSFTLAAALNPISTIITGYIMEYILITLPFLVYGISLILCFFIYYFNKECRRLK